MWGISFFHIFKWHKYFHLCGLSVQECPLFYMSIGFLCGFFVFIVGIIYMIFKSYLSWVMLHIFILIWSFVFRFWRLSFLCINVLFFILIQLRKLHSLSFVPNPKLNCRWIKDVNVKKMKITKEQKKNTTGKNFLFHNLPGIVSKQAIFKSSVLSKVGTWA